MPLSMNLWRPFLSGLPQLYTICQLCVLCLLYAMYPLYHESTILQYFYCIPHVHSIRCPLYAMSQFHHLLFDLTHNFHINKPEGWRLFSLHSTWSLPWNRSDPVPHKQSLCVPMLLSMCFFSTVDSATSLLWVRKRFWAWFTSVPLLTLQSQLRK